MDTRSILDVFLEKLERDWKRQAWCGRYFYLTGEIGKWMRRVQTNNQKNVVLLLLMVHGTDGFDVRSPVIIRDDDPCVLVFTILILLGRGNLVSHFRKFVTDRRLADGDVSGRTDLIDELVNEAEVLDYEELLRHFDHIKWGFCTRPFTLEGLHIGEDFLGGDWILPFFKLSRITEGGTAIVYEALIHEDMVDEAFRKAAETSRQVREGIGAYYHVAIKSYSEQWRDSFKDELEAFSGISALEGFVVQYLGHYSYEKRDDQGTIQRTYNIILEYGEMDLMEYMADDQQHPPVMEREIIQFWKLLLNPARAIDKIHNLDYEAEDKKKRPFAGWHADIKPKNILCVHGEFKLADFGFARFVKAKKGAKPETDIYGGTEAFGAPEQYRNKRQNTKTGATQAIDIWSFGCVLSVIATWVTLGFQGVGQYEAFRTAALAKLNEKRKPHERINIAGCFHDGKELLNQVTQWHTYLGKVIRQSDTVTKRILNLIHDRLLKSNPGDRADSEEMVTRLRDIIKEAEGSWERSGFDQDFLEGLLSLYEEAPATAKQAKAEDENAKVVVAQRQQNQGENSQQAFQSARVALQPSLIVPGMEPGANKSVRIGYPNRVSVRLGRVAGRKEALMLETNSTSENKRLEESSRPAIRITGLTEEPEEMSPRPSPSVPQADSGPTPSKPATKLSPKETSVRFSQDIGRRGGSSGSMSQQPLPPQAPHFMPHSQPPMPEETPNPLLPRNIFYKEQPLPQGTYPPVRLVHQGYQPPTLQLQGTYPPSALPPGGTYPQPPRTQGTYPPPAPQAGTYAPPYRGAYPHHPPSQGSYPPSQDGSDPSSPYNNRYPTALPHETLLPSPIESPFQTSISRVPYQGTSPTMAPQHHGQQMSNPMAFGAMGGAFESTPRPMESHPPPLNMLHISDQSRWDSQSQNMQYEERNPPSQSGSPVQKRRPGREPEGDPEAQSVGVANVDKPEVVAGPSASITDYSRSPYDWQYPDVPIWEEHQVELDRRKGLFTRIVKDEKLAQFIVNRDIVFLVDNGTTMSMHWEWAKFVLHTLAMKLDKIDENGMDLYFTLGQISARKCKNPDKFKKLMDEAKPRFTGLITDLAVKLSAIFEEYLKDPSKEMTVVVLTDGIWSGSSVTVEDQIAKFVKSLEDKIDEMKVRWFTIQFISFGNDADGLERLRRLDDDMTKNHGISDIIDTKPWNGPVDNMILGSIHEGYEPTAGPSTSQQEVPTIARAASHRRPPSSSSTLPPPAGPSQQTGGSKRRSVLNKINKFLG